MAKKKSKKAVASPKINEKNRDRNGYLYHTFKIQVTSGPADYTQLDRLVKDGWHLHNSPVNVHNSINKATYNFYTMFNYKAPKAREYKVTEQT